MLNYLERETNLKVREKKNTHSGTRPMRICALHLEERRRGDGERGVRGSIERAGEGKR